MSPPATASADAGAAGRPARRLRPADRLSRGAGAADASCGTLGIRARVLSNGEPRCWRRRGGPPGSRAAGRGAERRGGRRVQARSSRLRPGHRLARPAAREVAFVSSNPGTRSARTASASGCSGSTAPASPTNTGWPAGDRRPDLPGWPGCSIDPLPPACAGRHRVAGRDRSAPRTPGRRRRQRLLPRPPLHRVGRPPHRVGARLAGAARAAAAVLVAGARRARGRRRALLVAASLLLEGWTLSGLDAGLFRRPVRPVAPERGGADHAGAARGPHARPSGHARRGAAGGAGLDPAPAGGALRRGAAPRWRRWSSRRRSTCASTC